MLLFRKRPLFLRDGTARTPARTWSFSCSTPAQRSCHSIRNKRKRPCAPGAGTAKAGIQPVRLRQYLAAEFPIAPFTAAVPATVFASRPNRLSLSDNGREEAMQVSLEIPEDLGRRIVADPGELPRAALEGLALEAIRTGRLTVSQALRG